MSSSSSSSSSRSPSAPAEPTVPRRSLGEVARAREQLVPVAARLLGVRLEIAQVPADPGRAEGGSQPRPESVYGLAPSSLPYWIGVSRRLHWIVLGSALARRNRHRDGDRGNPSAGNAGRRPPAISAAAADDFLQPNLDPGAPLSAVAPGFTLTDQFGQTRLVALAAAARSSSSRSTIRSARPSARSRRRRCSRRRSCSGRPASQVELLGIGANPEATQVKWVRAYSQAHGMLHKWRFLTGSLPQLRRVWRAYGIDAAVVNGTVDHTPATFVIDPSGRESRLFETAMAYSSVKQLGDEMARSIAAAPPRPSAAARRRARSPSRRSTARSDPVTLPRAGGGIVRLGPGTGAHLVLFFDTLGDRGHRPERSSSRRSTATRRRPSARVSRRSSRSTRAGVEASPQALPRLPAQPAPPAFVSGRRRQERQRRRRLPRAGLALARARLAITAASSLYEDLAVKGWPTLRKLFAQIQPPGAREVKAFRRICTNLPEVAR